MPSQQGPEGPNPGAPQEFRQFGQRSRDFTTAIGDIMAMSERFRFVGRDVAEYAGGVMRQNVVDLISPAVGEFHGFSHGRLAATIGWWDESLIDATPEGAIEAQQAIEWASVNCPNEQRISGDERTLVENGAYYSLKRWRSNTWAVEIGTYTPYAGLVEDGGSMEIPLYGDPNRTVVAHWEANHMFKRGMFNSYRQLERYMDTAVRNITRQR